MSFYIPIINSNLHPTIDAERVRIQNSDFFSAFKFFAFSESKNIKY